VCIGHHDLFGGEGVRSRRPRVTNNDIQAYYTGTSFDYWAAWLNARNLAMHFGYQDDDTVSHSESLTNANEVLAHIAEVGPGDRVLDAGCGLGGSSLWLATKKKARVTGIALGVDQIGAAIRAARQRSLVSKLQFLVADFTKLPFPEKSFDVIWAQESLCHAADKFAFFAEAERVLMPNGRIVIADFVLKRASFSAVNERMLGEWFQGWKMPWLWTAAQLANAASSAGLRDIAINDITRHTRPSHRRLYQRARMASPLAALLRSLGARSHIQHGNFIAALRQYQTLRNDCWVYAILSARKAK